MNQVGLTERELNILRGAFGEHPSITRVRVFGSRAKLTHRPNSDVDLAVWSDSGAQLPPGLALDLDELPLPYIFDVIAFEAITSPDLRDHIERVGVDVFQR